MGNCNKTFVGANVSAYSLKQEKNLIIRIYLFLFCIFKILKFRPTHIICGRNGDFLIISYLVSKIFKIPFIFSAHNSIIKTSHNLSKNLIYKLNRYLIKKSKCVICHGPYLVSQAKTIGYPESSIIEFDSGVIDLHQNISQKDYHSITDEFNIVYIGRVEEEKGVFDLLNACWELLDARVNLVYVGNGSAMIELKEKVRSSEKARFVHFLGKIPYNDLGSILINSSLMVTPTRSSFPEGRCMSAMEGMSFGLPVIAPNAGPFPYIVEHKKNGLLFKQDSVDELRKCIFDIVNDSTLFGRMRIQAKISGDRFKYPEVSFYQAIQKAFSG